MEMIARDHIHPNDWNANAFDPEHYPKLVESIRQKGFMEPLKVTRDPQRQGHFLLIDGYNRWKAAGELCLEEIPCEVWEVSVEEAKVRGLQLNYLRWQPVPERLASLVHELNRELSLPDLAGMLPWSESQLRDSVELLKLPADLTEQVERQVAAQSAKAPVPVTVVMLPREHEAFEEAMSRAREELGKGARRGELWAHLCRCYVGSAATTPTPESGDEVRRDSRVGADAPETGDAPLDALGTVVLRPLGER